MPKAKESAKPNGTTNCYIGKSVVLPKRKEMDRKSTQLATDRALLYSTQKLETEKGTKETPIMFGTLVNEERATGKGNQEGAHKGQMFRRETVLARGKLKLQQECH
jgi:hypothetical protein